MVMLPKEDMKSMLIQSRWLQSFLEILIIKSSRLVDEKKSELKKFGFDGLWFDSVLLTSMVRPN